MAATICGVARRRSPRDVSAAAESPETPLAYYRLYFLDSAGRIRDVTEMECVDDAAALQACAPHLGKGQALERLVRQLPASVRAA